MNIHTIMKMCKLTQMISNSDPNKEQDNLEDDDDEREEVKQDQLSIQILLKNFFHYYVIQFIYQKKNINLKKYTTPSFMLTQSSDVQ